MTHYIFFPFLIAASKRAMGSTKTKNCCAGIMDPAQQLFYLFYFYDFTKTGLEYSL